MSVGNVVARESQRFRSVVAGSGTKLSTLVQDFGQCVGDQLLIEVAERLSRSIRASDTVARLGGDEFVIVREDVADVNEAVEFAERICTHQHHNLTSPKMQTIYVCGHSFVIPLCI